MSWKTFTLTLAAAVLAMGFAAKPKAPPPKPAPAAAKPAAAKTTAHSAAAGGDFDARNPMSLIDLLNSSGGKAQVAGKEQDSVLVTVTSTAADFSMQFAGCDAQGRACKVVLFDNITDKAGPSFAQLNAFNQTSAMCRGYEDKGGRPHVVYSTLLFADDSKARLRQQFLAWTGCIGDFRTFLKDPNAYLASAP
jgi:hypothetical protein